MCFGHNFISDALDVEYDELALGGVVDGHRDVEQVKKDKPKQRYDDQTPAKTLVQHCMAGTGKAVMKTRQ